MRFSMEAIYIDTSQFFKAKYNIQIKQLLVSGIKSYWTDVN